MTSDPLGGRAVFRAFLGEPRGIGVLDLGRMAPDLERWALDRGASGYQGIEVEDLDGWSGDGLGVFGLVVSWMALHRVRNIARLLETVHHHLAPGGRLVFAVPHPIVTASPKREDDGPACGRRVRGYFEEGERTDGDTVIWHRTLEGYLYELRCCGFQLVELSEGRPMPGDSAVPEGRPRPEAPSHVVFRCQRGTR